MLSQYFLCAVESISLLEELVLNRISPSHKFLVEVFAIVPERNDPPLKDGVCVLDPFLLFVLLILNSNSLKARSDIPKILSFIRFG